MKVTDPFASENAEPPKAPAPDPRYTYTASRVLAGHCPDCGLVLVVFNDGQTWPLVGCTCGWKGGTSELPSVRLDAEGRRDALVDVRGYFPGGAALRVLRLDADAIELLLADARDLDTTPAERGGSSLIARVIVRGGPDH